MEQVQEFQETVWSYYVRHGRSMPWRTNHHPYFVLVSELMLQQTQVSRVIPKFEAFIEVFPDISVLAEAPLDAVLRMWQGLGYNRRARFLHEAAKMVVRDFGCEFPSTLKELVTLPGVGKNTAGALLAYAFDAPVAFVETNIRTVLFHHFFNGVTAVDDNELLVILQQSLPDEHFREWYWALMDYGSYLKKTAGGRLDQSRHYKKQSPLRGSIREVRGQIIRVLTGGSRDEAGLKIAIAADERFIPALDGLLRDGLVSRSNDTLRLTA